MVVYTPLLIYKPAKSSHQVMRPPHQTIQTKGVGGERLAKGGTRGIFRGVARSQVSRINKKYGRLIDNKRGLCQFVEKDFSHSGTSSIVHINNWIVCSCHLHGTLHTHTNTHTHTHLAKQGSFQNWIPWNNNQPWKAVYKWSQRGSSRSHQIMTKKNTKIPSMTVWRIIESRHASSNLTIRPNSRSINKYMSSCWDLKERSESPVLSKNGDPKK